MGEVWLAHDTVLGRDVALKALGPAGLDDRALEHEAKTLARLRHPGIVTVFDLATIGDEQYLVLEAVPGTPLADVIAEQEPLAESTVRRVGAQIAGALAYAHDHGVLHNDVKPANILFDGEQARLIDFGIAGRPLQTISPSERATLVGTLPYLAPELIQGARPGPASDIYALGVTLFEALAGRTPWADARSSGLAERLVSESPSVRLFAPDASPSIDAILTRALKPAAGERFHSAAEFAAALDARDTRPIAVAAALDSHDTRPIAFAPPAVAEAGRNGIGWKAPVLVAVGSLLLGASVLAALSRNDGGGAGSTPTPSASVAAAAATAAPTEAPTSPPPTATSRPTSAPTVRPTATPTKQPFFFPGNPGNPGKKKGHDK